MVRPDSSIKLRRLFAFVRSGNPSEVKLFQSEFTPSSCGLLVDKIFGFARFTTNKLRYHLQKPPKNEKG